MRLKTRTQKLWLFRQWLDETGYRHPEIQDMWTRFYVDGKLYAGFVQKFEAWLKAREERNADRRPEK